MGKLKVFEVVFDGGNDLFRAGEWVQGHVRIVLSEPKSDIRGIQIKYKGKGKTHWTEHETHGTGDDRRTETVHYYAKEKYFEEKMLIMGQDKHNKSGEKIHLDAGEHNFPFKFQVPNKPLPHAFEGHYGRIRYKVRGKIDRPWKFDHTTERLFSIVGCPIDLNTRPNAQMPCRLEDEKTVCCLCCASGPIKCSAETDKSGYVPGETIWVSGFVENNSSRDIGDITAKLIQKIHFRAKRQGHGWEHHREEKRKLGEQRTDGCGEYSTASFDRKPILVPAVPPSGLEGCQIMDIEYYVEFEADVAGTPFDLELKLPVTIGTVPLYSAYSNPAFPPAGGVVTQQPGGAPELPPPSYELAMGGTQEIPSKSGHDYTFGKLMYAPRYPYYTFPDAGDPAHPPPAQGMYPPPGGDPAQPPPDGGMYPPAQPPPADGGMYPPPGGPAQPPADGGGMYPPPGGPAQPPADGGGMYPPPGGPPADGGGMYPPPGGPPADGGGMYPPPGGPPADGGGMYPPPDAGMYPPAAPPPNQI